MKKIDYIILALTTVLLMSESSFSQDSIGINDIKKFTYAFDLVDGALQGEGRNVLLSALEESQFVILGDHHRSKLEYEFASVLVDQLDDFHCKNLVLEIGWLSSLVLNRHLKSQTYSSAALRQLNQTYTFNNFVPIGHFKSRESVGHIEKAVSSDWSTYSIGLDSWSSYSMIFDFLYDTLPSKQQNELKSIYTQAKHEIDDLYKNVTQLNNDQILELTEAIKNSKKINQYLDYLRLIGSHEELIEHLDESIDFWWKYGKKDFYTKNKFNARNNKSQMRQIFEDSAFDFENDKLLLYGWQNHLASGITSNGFSGIGNTLNEMAAYHGNKSLNIAMVQRFYKTDDGIVDRSKSDDHYSKLFSPFNQLGSRDTWTIIDLRPFNKEFFWGNYKLTPEIERIFRRYDMLIIPKMDEPTTPNY